MKKNQKLKISKETVQSVLNKKDMKSIQGGYAFSLINGCSHSLCVSGRCDGIGFTLGPNMCC